MKGAKGEIARANRIRVAVTKATGNPGVTCIGARIEEMLGESIENYPKEIISLDLLPLNDNFEFIGFTADFEEVDVTQSMMGNTPINSAKQPLVGWRPKRLGILAGQIMAQGLDAAYKPAAPPFDPDAFPAYTEEPYRGIKFCNGTHRGDPCKDPFCIKRR